MSTTRRPLGTGPRPAEAELSPTGDSRERRTAAERAAVEPPARATKDQVETRPPGRRTLGTGGARF
ncbi:hypothetical protein [Streptomyces sp. NPDC058572]|uniref:hypothetical protein n=1 Tax=Streptomyces sp. NPDC058572 TaxID=3346546 RepID=UPI003662A573